MVADKRVLVVGASSGLGRGIGVALAAAGARVALAARRRDRLDGAVAEAGANAVPLVCDVRDPADCERVVAEAVDALGGLDGLVYCPAVGHLRMLADTGADLWQEMLQTNLVGAALVTRAAIGHLEASGGRAIYLASDSASMTPPWPGLGGYIVSKAGLDKLVDAWRAEHPGVAFNLVVVGPTAGEGESMTEFANAWDQDLAARLMPGWIERGYMSGNLVSLVDLTDQITAILSSGADLSRVVVRPRT
jgi:NAD(P)-dependent dehydrogenase (short-subunit alcohol dehydrogenase family)